MGLVSGLLERSLRCAVASLLPTTFGFCVCCKLEKSSRLAPKGAFETIRRRRVPTINNLHNERCDKLRVFLGKPFGKQRALKLFQRNFRLFQVKMNVTAMRAISHSQATLLQALGNPFFGLTC